jgi:hypothetical protein
LDATQLVAGDGAAWPWHRGQLADALAAAARGSRGALRVQLGGDMAGLFAIEPPRGLKSLGELRGLAAMRAAQVLGSHTWRVAADWSASGPFACAAVPEALVRELADAAHGAGRRLVLDCAALVALARLSRRAPQAQALAWTSPRTRYLALLDRGRVVAWRGVASHDTPDAATLADWAWREGWQEGLRMGREIDRVTVAWSGSGRAKAANDRVSWLDAGDGIPAPIGTEADWARRLAAQ